MVKRTRYAEWKDSYKHYKFELSPEGILLMQCHTDGGPLQWMWESHDRMSDAFADIAGDRDGIRCVIHTGTGDYLQRPVGEARDGGRDSALPRLRRCRGRGDHR